MKAVKWPIIYRYLDQYGEISRNQALSNYISRLASRIKDLEKHGWIFRTEQRDGDYVYIVVVRGRNHLLEGATPPKQLQMIYDQ
jgi:hypothetical protein